MKTLASNLGRSTFVAAAAALTLAAVSAKASPTIPYPTPGTPNPVTYTFTATATGDIVAYFAGTGASYTESLGMEDNGVLTSAGFGLGNHSSSVGDSFDLGSVTAGDTLTFVVDVTSPALGEIFSDPSLNGSYDLNGRAGHNHVYSTPYTDGSLGHSIPSGTYVGFEDLQFPDSDFNYFDETYVFTDVGVTTHTAPDATSSLTLLGMGFAGLGLLRRRFAK
jgi:hypothetical protein